MLPDNLALAAVALTALAASPFAHAQSSWSLVSPTSSNNPAGVGSLTGASDGSAFYHFGGRFGSPAVFPGGTHLSDELWRFDGAAWTNLSGATNPARREFFALAYHAPTGKLVLFGGKDVNNGSLGDTWVWDQANGWINLAPAVAPSARHWHAMVYDDTTGQLVMFGGYDGTNFMNDTWTFDGAAWTLQSPATSPSVRGRHGMAFDSYRGRAVLFGGTSTNPRPMGDTWEWSSASGTWTQVSTATVPYTNTTAAGCVSPGMTYDPVRRRTVMVGGYDNVNTNQGGGGTTGDNYEDNTWEYDGNDWVDRGTDPVLRGRGGPAVAYVLALGATVCYGGFNDAFGGNAFPTNTAFPRMDNQVYTWRTSNFASFVEDTNSPGCPNASGTPSISATALPWAGSTANFQITNVPGGSLPFVLFGFVPMTTNLGIIGFPNCNVYMSSPVTFGATPTAGGANWDLPIPDLASIYGANFILQGGTLTGLAIALTGQGNGTFGAF